MPDRRPDIRDKDPYALGYWAGARAEAESRDEPFRGFGNQIIDYIEALSNAERRRDPHATWSDTKVAERVAMIWLTPRDLLRLLWVKFQHWRRYRT
jgi:hypothetical protein